MLKSLCTRETPLQNGGEALSLWAWCLRERKTSARGHPNVLREGCVGNSGQGINTTGRETRGPWSRAGGPAHVDVHWEPALVTLHRIVIFLEMKNYYRQYIQKSKGWEIWWPSVIPEKESTLLFNTVPWKGGARTALTYPKGKRHRGPTQFICIGPWGSPSTS